MFKKISIIVLGCLLTASTVKVHAIDWTAHKNLCKDLLIGCADGSTRGFLYAGFLASCYFALRVITSKENAEYRARLRGGLAIMLTITTISYILRSIFFRNREERPGGESEPEIKTNHNEIIKKHPTVTSDDLEYSTHETDNSKLVSEEWLKKGHKLDKKDSKQKKKHRLLQDTKVQ